MFQSHNERTKRVKYITVLFRVGQVRQAGASQLRWDSSRRRDYHADYKYQYCLWGTDGKLRSFIVVVSQKHREKWIPLK